MQIRTTLDQLWNETRLAARLLIHSPGFAVPVALTLALAVGAATAIFNVADEALFRPLPVPEAGQLTAVYNYNQKTARYVSTSYPDYLDYTSRAQSFDQLSAYVRFPLAVSADGPTLRAQVEAVTANYFAMLRVSPVIGSSFTSEDAPEALLSERFWREHFGANPLIPGGRITIERQPFTIAGVVPDSYRGVNLNWSEPPEIWIPMRALAIAVPRLRQIDIFAQRSARWLVIFGRRKHGVTVEQAQSELQALAANIASTDPAGADITVRAFEAGRSKFWPGFREKVTLSLSVFAIATVLILVLACLNISNLMLERALTRQREIAIRLAIGAGRARLVRQTLLEALLLVAPGFLGGLAVSGILAGLIARSPRAIGEVTLWLQPGLDLRALLFAFVVSVAAAMLFGLVPALRSTRLGPQSILKEYGSGLTRDGWQRLRAAMVVGQIAFTAVLLFGGGLFVRSTLRAYSLNPGFRTDHLITAGFDLSSLAPQARGALERRLLEESAALPGIESASVSSGIPLTSGRVPAQVSTPGGAPYDATLLYAGAGFFHTMGIPLSAGREFVSRDENSRVAVITEDLARRLWPGTEPVGQVLAFRRGNGESMPFEVVGVAEAVKTTSIWGPPESQIYLPSGAATGSARSWVLRTRGNPVNSLSMIRELWNRVAPDIPLYDLRIGDEILAEAVAAQRLAARLFGAFGMLAVMLAGIGLYSLIASSVAMRTREIGIRMALGSAPRAVVGKIFSRTLLLAIFGLMTGLPAGIRLGRLASPLVHEVSPSDWMSLSAVVVSVLAISGLAAILPARRASRVDPVVALRHE
jgi:putative ABC transport system permease protein